MPTRFTTNFARLTDANEFEDLVRDLCVLEWNDPDTKRFGRSGQTQHGVDVYGQPEGLNGIYWGAQCKLRKKETQLSEKDIEDEAVIPAGKI